MSITGSKAPKEVRLKVVCSFHSTKTNVLSGIVTGTNNCLPKSLASCIAKSNWNSILIGIVTAIVLASIHCGIPLSHSTTRFSSARRFPEVISSSILFC